MTDSTGPVSSSSDTHYPARRRSDSIALESTWSKELYQLGLRARAEQRRIGLWVTELCYAKRLSRHDGRLADRKANRLIDRLRAGGELLYTPLEHSRGG